MPPVHAENSSDAPSVRTTGGAGLHDHSSRDPFPKAAGWISGVVSVVLALGVGFALVNQNAAAFSSGRASGTADQIGVPGPKVPAVLVAPAPGSVEDQGRILIAQKCGSCHVVPGISSANGHVGPSLAGLAGKTAIAGGAVAIHGPDDLKKWVLNPPALKPGTQMPNLGLTEEEATNIVAYLQLLK
jgi:cytochrome c2